MTCPNGRPYRHVRPEMRRCNYTVVRSARDQERVTTRAARLRNGTTPARPSQRAQGLLFTDDLPELERRHRLPRPHGLQGGRHHLPPARLLGPHRAGRALRARRHRLRHAAALRLPRHPRAQGGQAAARHRGLPPADPRRDPAPARARRRGPRPDHPDERRRLASTSAPRPTRSSTWSRAARASSASPSAASGARSRASSPSCPASAPRTRRWPPTPTTSSRAARARPGWPEPAAGPSHQPAAPTERRAPRVDWLADHPAWESPRARAAGRRRGKLPGTSQAPGPRG